MVCGRVKIWTFDISETDAAEYVVDSDLAVLFPSLPVDHRQHNVNDITPSQFKIKQCDFSMNTIYTPIIL